MCEGILHIHDSHTSLKLRHQHAGLFCALHVTEVSCTVQVPAPAPAMFSSPLGEAMSRNRKRSSTSEPLSATSAGSGEQSQAAPARTSGKRRAARKRATRKKSAVRARRRTKVPRRHVAAGGRGGRFSDARRQEILQIAARERLTGAQVSKRFGISQVTYYLWRKKAGSVKRGSATVNLGGMEATIRSQVRSALQAMLPQLIEGEIATMLGGGQNTRRRR